MVYAGWSETWAADSMVDVANATRDDWTTFVTKHWAFVKILGPMAG